MHFSRLFKFIREFTIVVQLELPDFLKSGEHGMDWRVVETSIKLKIRLVRVNNQIVTVQDAASWLLNINLKFLALEFFFVVEIFRKKLPDFIINKFVGFLIGQQAVHQLLSFLRLNRLWLAHNLMPFFLELRELHLLSVCNLIDQ